MMYLGDFPIGGTVHFKWNTSGADGASITRGTNGTVYVYKDDATGTEVTTGVTDTEDHDGNTGVHHCKIVLTDAFYVPGEYDVVLKAATIDSQTVNAVLAHFSIARTASGAYVGVCTDDGSTTTLIDSVLTQSATDFFKGRVVIMLTGTLALQASKITEFTPATDTVTFEAMTGAPATGDRYMIV